jgi:hypothetical protein
MTEKSRIVHSDPGIMSGTPVFVGTRVPVQSLFDYIEGGDTLDDSSGNSPRFNANTPSPLLSSDARRCALTEATTCEER